MVSNKRERENSFTNRIIEYLWDNEMFVDDNTLSVNIRRIRAKLEKIGIYNYIHTKHGQGYSV